MRVKNYFEYLHTENIEENEQAEQILSKLCDSMRDEVNQNIYYQQLQKKKIFTLNFSPEFLKKLSTKMTEKWL